MTNADVGLIGLGTMGANLARNIASKGFKCSVYNRTTEKINEFIAQFGNENLAGYKELSDFVKSIKSPRKIIIMVKAGSSVDKVIETLKPLLDENDIIIDCGNENYKNTQLRYSQLKKEKLRFIGSGVSGGEEGALKGPSIMLGGDKETYKEIKEIFEAIAAKDFSGGKCVTYIGDNGAGHYVKMVHNGIEYSVMQMIAESYELFRSIYKINAEQIANIFEKYNNAKLHSYLFEIVVPVLRRKDEFQKGYLVDYILDKAGQKGTGTWTAIDALYQGVTLSSITEAVFARTASNKKEKRIELSKLYKKDKQINPSMKLEEVIKLMEDALYAGMLSSYAQGYDLILNAAKEENWDIDLGEISRIWEGGCIIRADILNFLHQAYSNFYKNTVNTDLTSSHLFQIPEVVEGLNQSIHALRKIVCFGLENHIAMPSLATALTYFDTMTSEKTSANLIQGLRDYFGAHTYERTDREGFFHTEWN